MREISSAEQQLEQAQASVADLETQLDRALAVASNCAGHYGSAGPAVRRLMNQGFFTKLYIGQDGGVERADLTEPFDRLLDRLEDVQMGSQEQAQGLDSTPGVDGIGVAASAVEASWEGQEVVNSTTTIRPELTVTVTYTASRVRHPNASNNPTPTVVGVGFEQRGCGGRGGIRTHGTVAGTTVFKTVSIDHSDTLP